MAQTELFRRYIWLVDLIYRHNGITREEINRCWSRSYLNTAKEDEIPERTFHRHKEAIKELFDVDIICDRHGDKTYHIANGESLTPDGAMGWLLNNFTISNVLDQFKDIKHRILFEKIPSGQDFLETIATAMREGLVIQLNYQSFGMSAPAIHEVEPYCLKIYKQRWYLLGRNVKRDVMRTFALDRIKGIEFTDKKFYLPDSFDAEKYFEDTIGITIEKNCNAQIVEIQATNGAENYLRSLPLHFSQKEYSTDSCGAKFKIFAQPNNDLIQELLRHGEDVTVISPKWFRDKFQDIVNKMSNNYIDK